MKTKFTPGPWLVDQTVSLNPAVVSSRKSTHAICTMGFRSKEYWANATLIAAAPDLYAALADLVDTVESKAGLTDYGSYDAEDEFGISEARMALKKASL